MATKANAAPATRTVKAAPKQNAKTVPPARRTDPLYHDAWMAMREASARLAEFEEMDADTFYLAPQIARACRHHLYLIRPFFKNLNGRETHILEDALSRTEAILIGVHAIARFHEEDPDPWEAWTAIGFLSRLLDEHTAEGAAEGWAARDREFNELCDEIGDSAAWEKTHVEGQAGRSSSLRRGDLDGNADEATDDPDQERAVQSQAISGEAAERSHVDADGGGRGASSTRSV